MTGHLSILRLHSFLLLALALPSLSQTTKPEGKKATIRVQVITAAEEVIPDPRILLLNSAGKKVGEFRKSQATDIPYGDYELRVEQQGFEPFKQKLRVREPDVKVTARIVVGDIGNYIVIEKRQN